MCSKQKQQPKCKILLMQNVDCTGINLNFVLHCSTDWSKNHCLGLTFALIVQHQTYYNSCGFFNLCAMSKYIRKYIKVVLHKIKTVSLFCMLKFKVSSITTIDVQSFLNVTMIHFSFYWRFSILPVVL